MPAPPASGPPPWRKHTPSAFLLQTRGFSRAEVGLYVQLLDIYWVNGGRLPAEPVLKRQLEIRSASDQELLQAVLDAFFVRDGDAYSHPESDAQLSEITTRRQAEAERLRQYRARKRSTPPETYQPSHGGDF